MKTYFDPPDALPFPWKALLTPTPSEFDQVRNAWTAVTGEPISSPALASGCHGLSTGIGFGWGQSMKSVPNDTEEEEAARGRIWWQSASLGSLEEGGCDG
jgi:hypothetical protein